LNETIYESIETSRLVDDLVRWWRSLYQHVNSCVGECHNKYYLV
jgi:hypothetical protein